MKKDTVTIIAGPCSLNPENIAQLYEIAEITVPNPDGRTRSAVWGVRAVGMKSRTTLSLDGKGMGMDHEAYTHNLEVLMQGGGSNAFIPLPSVEIARKFGADTGLNVATEVVDPAIQLPSYAHAFPNGKLLVWNPAVSQIGYPTLVMGEYAKRYGWHIGLKNGKWLGEEHGGSTPLENTWAGLASYADPHGELKKEDRLFVIHRGVDVPGKGSYRNLPVHMEAGRVKKRLGTKLFFDPSHTCGPEMRDTIVEETLSALRMELGGEYLYDGILIEVGNSLTDTGQHITLDELRSLSTEIAKFRSLHSPHED